MPSLEFHVLADKHDRAYRPNYAFARDTLGAQHHAIEASISEIPGWLRSEDVLKLYELAYFAAGDILEIGTYRGKSAAVIATALREAVNPARFVSLDVSKEALLEARRTLERLGVAEHVSLFHGTSHDFFLAFPDYSPMFVFVDGDHSFDGVRGDLAELSCRVRRGGLLLFHDYLDDRNDDPAVAAYGVKAAIEGSWIHEQCDFAGTFGCCALFSRREVGP